MRTMPEDTTADAIRESFFSTMEEANIVDVLEKVATATGKVALAITSNAEPGHDETGGHVECLTEAVMGLTSAGEHIASALSDIAEAIRELKAPPPK